MEIELLAPVGSFEAFKSALDNGANAIYLAGTKFGAREKATFTNEELISIIKEAHLNEVKVYVTVNTLIYDDELEDVMQFIDFLYNNDCDAVIVQDLGLITLIHNIYPDFEIHASTQMNTMTVKQASILKQMGVKRVVVARETSIDIIKEIIDKVKIEVEVFIHGALCISYSGNCLFSSCSAKKSGNRGECLQLCRLPYSLYKGNQKIEDSKYLLSTRDLNTLDYLNEIVDAKITSLKIEGRLKSGAYVGMVTRVYRKYLDKYKEEHKLLIEKEDEQNLKQVFNREFTKGYLFNERNSSIVNINRPNNMGVKIGKVIDYRNNRVYIKLDKELNQGDGIRIVGTEDIGFYVNMMEVKRLLVNKAISGDIVSIATKSKVEINSPVYKTTDIKLNEEIEKNSKRRKFRLNVKVKAHINEKIEVTFTDDLNNSVTKKSEYIVIEANKSPTSKEKIKEQLSKLNDTCYYLNEIEIDSDEMVLIPVSILNELRRELVASLNELRYIKHKRIGKQNLSLEKVDVKQDNFTLKVKVSNETQYALVKNYVLDKDIYYYNENNTYPYPRISENKIKTAKEKVLLNELHDINKDKEMIANYYMNCTNIFTLYTLYKLGFKRVTLSIEMTQTRIINLINNYKNYFKVNPNIEVLIYSKTDLMITKYCPINKCLEKNSKECGECLKNKYYLEDRKGYKISLIKDYFCNIRLLNPRALMLLEYVNKLRYIGVNCVRIEFNDEELEDCKNIMDSYFKKDVELDSRKFTYGYFKEKEDE